jgi:Rrf2 family protein
MLLTKKSEYALLSLITIAKSKELKNVDQISNELQLSKSSIAKIMQNLSKAGIVKSFKGSTGGFILNKELDEISISDIIKIAEKKTPIVFECSSSIESCPNMFGNYCTLWPLLNKLQNKIDNFLEQLTLKDIL